MATYAIGDVQGCFKPLQNLLAKIGYRPEQDQLWFAGDIVNRGPHSLDTLRFITQLPASTVCVLGNHDLALLAIAESSVPIQATHTLEEILQAPDSASLLSWLRHRPLLHHDTQQGYTLTHAGIFPLWSLPEAQKYAREVEAVLQSQHYVAFLDNMYGDAPTHWQDGLTDWERLRFIVNTFTRMRFCTKDGGLNLHLKGTPAESPNEIPWFAFPGRRTMQDKLLFGHWAALEGKCEVSHVYPLDSGCGWGKCLTAFCLQTQERITVDCG